MLIKNKLRLFSVGGVLVALAACGGGEKSTPRQQAINTISKTASDASRASNHVFVTPAASATSGGSSSARASTLNKALSETKQSNVWKALKQAPLTGQFLNKLEKAADETPEVLAGMDEITKFMLENMLSNPEPHGDVTLYKPDGEKLCSTADASDQAECKALFNHVTIAQRITGENSGELAFKYDSKSPFLLGYAPNHFYIEIYLADSIDVLNTISVDGQTVADSIDAVGTLRFGVQVDGDKTAVVEFGVMEDVRIHVADSSSSAQLDIAKAPSALRISANETQHKGSIEFGFGAVEFEFSEKIYGQDEVTQLSIEKWSGSISINVTDDAFGSVYVKDFSLGEKGFRFFENGNLTIQIVADTPDASVTFENDNKVSFSYTEASHSKLFIDMQNLLSGLFDPMADAPIRITIDANIVKDTEAFFIEPGPFDPAVLELARGEFALTLTETYIDKEDVSNVVVKSGECLMLADMTVTACAN